MAVEPAVKNQVCKSCGADVRPSALFCYICGSSLAPDLNFETGQSGQAEQDKFSLPSDIAGEQNGVGNASKLEIGNRSAADIPIAKPFENLSEGKNKIIEKAEIKDRQPPAEKEAVLKTAAAVRRQAKPPQRRNIEVVWEQPQNSSNLWFLIAAVILIIFAVGSLLAMLYLR